jgi:hypothetical protein
MARKKQNKNSIINQTKLLDKKRREEFFDFFKYYINLLGGEDLYSLIPDNFKADIYHNRFYAIQINYPKSFIFTKEEKHRLELLFRNFLTTHFVKIENVKFKIDLEIFSTIVLTIFNQVKIIKDNDFPGAAKIRSKLLSISESKEYLLEYFKQLHIVSNIAVMGVNKLDKIFHLKMPKDFLKIGEYRGKYQIIELEQELPEKRKIRINNEVHVAYKFGGIFLNGFTWFTVNLEKFMPKSNQTVFNVYMQQHVVKRFCERIDYGANQILIYTLFLTFQEPIIIKYKGVFLLEYNDYNIKLGYFVGNVVEDIFLIRTFLFVTNNGTPEGDKLNELLKINHNDKDYLAINKLSTFLKMNGKEGNELKVLFASAGCENLFDMSSKLRDKITGLDEKPYEGKIQNYLAVDIKDDFTYNDDEILEIDAKLINNK